MDEKIERLLIWARGGKGLPLSLELSPTLRCNLNCLFCWRYGKKVEVEELTLDEYKKILKEAHQLRVKEVRIIGGGEPLVRKDTFEIMKIVKRYGMFGYVCTNGTLFSERTIKLLTLIGWDHIKISFHAPSRELQDLLAQGESFEKIVSTIKSFVKYKGRFRITKPRIEIGLVLTRLNFMKMVEMVKLAKELNVDAFFIEPLTVYTKKGKELKLRKDEARKFGEIASDAYLFANGLETNLQEFFSSQLIEKTGKMISEIKGLAKSGEKNFLNVPCYEPWWRMGIRTDGWVCPCGFLDQDTTENVREKSLKEIWFGSYFQRRREQLLKKSMPDYCQRCCVTLVQYNQIIREQLSSFL